MSIASNASIDLDNWHTSIQFYVDGSDDSVDCDIVPGATLISNAHTVKIEFFSWDPYDATLTYTMNGVQTVTDGGGPSGITINLTGDLVINAISGETW